jgi:alpha-mannosidase
VIIRVYNISSEIQRTTIKLNEFFKIRNAKIVNLLEEDPINPIKAQIENLNSKMLNISLEPHTIATIKLQIK